MRVVLLFLLAGMIPTFFEAFGAEERKLDGAGEEQIVQSLQCQNGQVVRTLEVHTHDAGCLLLYTKSGKTSEIARSRRGVDICAENLQKVRRTLEAGGYHCK